MITNKRQLAITKARIESIDLEISRQPELSNASQLVALYVGQLQAERKRLSEEVNEFELLASGLHRIIPASSLSELPLGLIKARIARGLSQKDLGNLIGVKEQQIQRYESQNYKTASFAKLLEIASALDIQISPNVLLEAKSEEKNPPSSRLKDIISCLPIEEMYKRGWFSYFQGTAKEARINASSLIEEHFSDVFVEDLAAFNRQCLRVDSSADAYSLIAWQLQALRISSSPQKIFNADLMSPDWFEHLIGLSVHEEGPSLVKAHLEGAGISFIILPHLPKTYLDGAALSSPTGHPVVALTLRHDRLDNFWFVLLHELAHVKMHLSLASSFFDDCEVETQLVKGIEREADSFASETLLPSAKWDISIARYLQSKESIINLSKELHIHPAIVAGRIRRETGNYVILKDLVGTGSVRRLFPEVPFAP